MMAWLRTSLLLACLGLSAIVQAQFPPEPKDVTIVHSKQEDGVYISYKENDLCETTEGVRSFAGYVHLPAGTLEDLNVNQTYDINTFFWFFESRKDPKNAPLSMWMNGGPGSSSLLGLLREHGPCWVNNDSNSTRLNEWSWNNEVNMLYLDQPVQVGLSYDKLVNVTLDLLTGDTTVANFTDGVPKQNNTFYVGTYPSQDSKATTQGTMNSARALWHFAQVWFQEFPEHKPNDDRISIATESYGGRYGPAFTTFFQQQNEKIKNGTWTEAGETHYLHLDTLLIINGCIDRLVQWPAYPQQAYNNTYGIKAINESLYNSALDALYKEGGCIDQIYACRNLSLAYDPSNQGFNTSVNKVCQAAETYCTTHIRDLYTDYSGRNYYDIASFDPTAFPEPFYEGFLNQPHVQQSLGVPLNWTQSSGPVATSFRAIGDYPRPGWKEDLAYLLDSGIKVALVYGDRDFACNWFGGEAVSLAINHTFADKFSAAGYSPVQVNGSYVGGQVRQYGNLSFTRVYEAGHEVPAYQPETALRIFQRALFNLDIATGKIDTVKNDTYASEGPTSVFDIKNEVIPMPAATCYVLDPESCTEEQYDTVKDGSALVKNWIVVDANTSHLFPNTNSTAGTPTSTVSLSTSATSKPSSTSAAPSAGANVNALVGMQTWHALGLSIGLSGAISLVSTLAIGLLLI